MILRPKQPANQPVTVLLYQNRYDFEGFFDGDDVLQPSWTRAGLAAARQDMWQVGWSSWLSKDLGWYGL